MDPTEWDRDGIGGPEQPGPADKASGTGKPVANLLDQYLTKRTALMAEVEHLAQLRDQVRGAADRETLDIVGKARQDAREVIAAARRELFVPERAGPRGAWRLRVRTSCRVSTGSNTAACIRRNLDARPLGVGHPR